MRSYKNEYGDKKFSYVPPSVKVLRLGLKVR